jgi:hypothetical protein
MRLSPAAARRQASPMDGLDGLVDGLGGPVHGFFFFLINRGQATVSRNSLFTVTMCSRRLSKTSWLNFFIRLG